MSLHISKALGPLSHNDKLKVVPKSVAASFPETSQASWASHHWYSLSLSPTAVRVEEGPNNMTTIGVQQNFKRRTRYSVLPDGVYTIENCDVGAGDQLSLIDTKTKDTCAFRAGDGGSRYIPHFYLADKLDAPVKVYEVLCGETLRLTVKNGLCTVDQENGGEVSSHCFESHATRTAGVERLDDCEHPQSWLSLRWNVPARFKSLQSDYPTRK